MILASVAELMNSAWPAGVMMLGLGGLFAVILLVASEKLKVEVDAKVEAIQGSLPGVDCGACGFAGCGSYAKAVAADPELIGKCAPGGSATAEKIAEILSLSVGGGAAPLRPVIHCNADIDNRTYYAKYEGIESCTAANALTNVQACKFGCVGYGDCVASCKFDAIHIVNGLATVDYDKCTGCTACSKACPKNIIEMVPFSEPAMTVVACHSQETGRMTRQMCKVGCIGCGLCKKNSDIFAVNNNLASVIYTDYKVDEGVETATTKCPTKVIKRVGKGVIAESKVESPVA
ncbi:MAG: RnfABCDGE type electron transport complex subunit B [Phycisphaerae bacterium]|nr:RnfABCDGE type electron transport complex subunit B [Phycisphaerae bacterium]